MFSTCVPLKVVRKKSKNNPWFNADIEHAIIERNLLHRRWKTSKTEHDYTLYKRKRNKVTSLINKARKNYYENFFNMNLSSQEFWSKVKNLKGNDTKFSSTGNAGNEPNSDEMNTYFASNFSQPENPQSVTTAEINNSFSFNLVNEYDVINSLYEIRSNATGLDEIPIKFIKLALPIFLKPITHLFNCILECNIFPND